MLARTRLGNNTRLTEPLGQEHLSDSIIDLVASCVIQVFTLQPNSCAARPLRQTLRLVQLARTANIVELIMELFPKIGVMTGCIIRPFKLAVALDKRLGNILSTKLAKVGGFRHMRLWHGL